MNFAIWPPAGISSMTVRPAGTPSRLVSESVTRVDVVEPALEIAIPVCSEPASPKRPADSTNTRVLTAPGEGETPALAIVTASPDSNEKIRKPAGISKPATAGRNLTDPTRNGPLLDVCNRHELLGATRYSKTSEVPTSASTATFRPV